MDTANYLEFRSSQHQCNIFFWNSSAILFATFAHSNTIFLLSNFSLFRTTQKNTVSIKFSHYTYFLGARFAPLSNPPFIFRDIRSRTLISQHWEWNGHKMRSSTSTYVYKLTMSFLLSDGIPCIVRCLSIASFSLSHSSTLLCISLANHQVRVELGRRTVANTHSVRL